MKVVTSVEKGRVILVAISPVLLARVYQGLLRDIRLHSREVENATGARLVSDMVTNMDDLFQMVNATPPEVSTVGVIIVSKQLEREACATVKYLAGLGRTASLVFLCDSEHGQGAVTMGRGGVYLAHYKHVSRGAIVKMVAK